jgi:hypothetical protein
MQDISASRRPPESHGSSDKDSSGDIILIGLKYRKHLSIRNKRSTTFTPTQLRRILVHKKHIANRQPPMFHNDIASDVPKLGARQHREYGG